MTPFVSVIVPVYGAAEGLGECLDRLAAQTYPSDRYEVIVVDNGSPSIEAVVRGREVRVLREPRPGSYTARNTGIRHAAGEVFAFTDDDCLPEADWLAHGVAALGSAGSTGIVAGEIGIVAPRPAGVAPATYAYSAIYSFRGRKDGPTYGATANLFVRRDVMERLGPFDERLLSGGDWMWGFRAGQQGVATRFHDDVRVLHRVRPTVAAIVKRELRLAGGSQMRRERPGSLRTLAGQVVNIGYEELVRRLVWSLRLLRQPEIRLTARERVKVAGIVLLVQVLRTFERLRVAFGGRGRRA